MNNPNLCRLLLLFALISDHSLIRLYVLLILFFIAFNSFQVLKELFSCNLVNNIDLGFNNFDSIHLISIIVIII